MDKVSAGQSDVELLADAWREAIAARAAGLIVGTPDELALQAAARRAVAADLAAGQRGGRVAAVAA